VLKNIEENINNQKDEWVTEL